MGGAKSVMEPVTSVTSPFVTKRCWISRGFTEFLPSFAEIGECDLPTPDVRRRLIDHKGSIT